MISHQTFLLQLRVFVSIVFYEFGFANSIGKIVIRGGSVHVIFFASIFRFCLGLFAAAADDVVVAVSVAVDVVHLLICKEFAWAPVYIMHLC